MAPPALLCCFNANPLLVAAASGLLCHQVFRISEPRQPAIHFALLGLAPGLAPFLLNSYLIPETLPLLYAAFYSTLAISVAAYRLSPFHPLADHPGPILCKLSKLWMAYISYTGRQHVYYKMLHDKYGPVVRVGPNELSICDATAVQPLMGANGVPKGPIWEGRLADPRDQSVIGLRDPLYHLHRRRLWNRAFSSASLKEYEPIIVKRVTQLVSVIANSTGPVDMKKMIGYFAYDFMSDMVFGGGSEMMLNGDKDGLWHMIDSSQVTALFLGHVPWLGAYYYRFPGVGASLKRYRAFARERAAMRRSEGCKTKDLFYHLMDEERREPTSPSMKQVVSDGGLAIIAGSDTTATALTVTLWNLLRHPRCYQKLRQEVDSMFPDGEEIWDMSKQSKMEYLNAVINESLRLVPPILSGSQRAPAKGAGARDAGPCILPEGSSAFVHTYSLHRDPHHFWPMPDAFWPERWLAGSSPAFPSTSIPNESPAKFVHNTAAFIPFSSGPANCVGKGLALQELRSVVCALVKHFDMRFADGFDGSVWEDSLKDYFVTVRGNLPVVFSQRDL